MNKFYVIAISGTPGTGKSTLAKLLVKKLNFYRLDLHHCYKDLSTSYDQKKRCYNVDLAAFERLVKTKIQELRQQQRCAGLVIDTHISHLLPPKLVDLCVVLTCSDLKQLQKRLKQRKYAPSKIRENLDAEIFQICLVEAREKGHKVMIFDNYKNKPFLELLSRIKRSLRIR